MTHYDSFGCNLQLRGNKTVRGTLNGQKSLDKLNFLSTHHVNYVLQHFSPDEVFCRPQLLKEQTEAG